MKPLGSFTLDRSIVFTPARLCETVGGVSVVLRDEIVTNILFLSTPFCRQDGLSTVTSASKLLRRER